MVEADGKNLEERTFRLRLLPDNSEYEKLTEREKLVLLLNITNERFPDKEIWSFDSAYFFMIVECSSGPDRYKREILVDPIRNYIRVFHRDYLKEASVLEKLFYERTKEWFTLKLDC